MLFTNNTLRWLEVIFRERFGQRLELTRDNEDLQLTLPISEATITFNTPQAIFHQSRSDFPCEYWKPSSEGFQGPIEDSIPAPSEQNLPTPLIEFHELGATVRYDILGLAYWMLTRLEEIDRTDLDNHKRFPATSSHAFKQGYLERPIVDEWLNVLGQVMLRIWPDIKLKQHQFSMKVSHDVDEPARYAFQSLKGLVRTVGGDVLFRKDITAALKAPWIWLKSKREIHSKDPTNTFDWLMKQSEENGLSSAFYFICGRTDASKDAKYDPEMPQIRKLMFEIHQRGHEIGLHPSYNTYNRPEKIAEEADRLWKVCEEESIQQSQWGGRMHFLRWDQAITQKALADAGMSYDSTLTYADRPGFRCGTCFDFPAFDLATDTFLTLRIIPLVAMDCTVMAERYLGLGSTEAAYNKFNELKNNCKKVNGVFTLLWHNSYFKSKKDFEIYSRLLQEL